MWWLSDHYTKFTDSERICMTVPELWCNSTVEPESEANHSALAAATVVAALLCTTIEQPNTLSSTGKSRQPETCN